jgi:hypothetical protein
MLKPNVPEKITGRKNSLLLAGAFLRTTWPFTKVFMAYV